MSATRLAAAGESAARPSARPGVGGRDREERRVRRPAVRPARESWRGDVRHPPGRCGRVRAAGASTPRRGVESSGTFDHHFTRVRAVDSSLRRAQHVGALYTSIPPSQFICGSSTCDNISREGVRPRGDFRRLRNYSISLREMGRALRNVLFFKGAEDIPIEKIHKKLLYISWRFWCL